MTTSRILAPRLLAGFGTAALVAAVGLFASSRPAHTAGGPIPVTVSNVPLATTRADGEAHQPFQTEVQFFQGDGVGFPTSSSFTVPAGKELVIQSYSCLGYAPGSSHALLHIQTTSGGTQTSHYAGFLSPGIGPYFTLPLTSATLHADPGTQVNVTIVRDVRPDDNTGYYDDITVSGYLVNVS